MLLIDKKMLVEIKNKIEKNNKKKNKKNFPKGLFSL